jgi:hypothetical protein
VNETGSNFRPASPNFFSSPLRRASNSRGAAPWNEKIDCFSSPTAKMVRWTPSRAPSPDVNSEMRDDIPLTGARVLRLVDQHVIDAAVELVMHPAGGDTVQHLQRLVDQIVIVEQAALLLLAPVIRSRWCRDVQQRLGPVADGQRAPPLDQGADALVFQIEQAASSRIVTNEAVRYHGSARRAFSFRQENAEINVYLLSTGDDQRLA